ncbi:MAG: hypothetical protein K2K87_14245 [Lachnospiraceae bacterium]|nr:hypothetical protein [Lachnospiraceae bacterium]
MFNNDGILMDKASYEQIWQLVIRPTMEDYIKSFSEVMVAHNAQEVIWQEYEKFNRHCKMQYMADARGKLDRHKVCASYMFAIVKANVMSCRLADSDTEQSYLALNENLAITVGMSLLRAFILASIDSSEDLTEEEKKLYRTRVDNGIVFPECNHGVYRDNFVSELHFSNLEGNYNILSLANTLFLLETHTLETEAVHKQAKKSNLLKKKKIK